MSSERTARGVVANGAYPAGTFVYTVGQGRGRRGAQWSTLNHVDPDLYPVATVRWQARCAVDYAQLVLDQATA